MERLPSGFVDQKLCASWRGQFTNNDVFLLTTWSVEALETFSNVETFWSCMAGTKSIQYQHNEGQWWPWMSSNVINRKEKHDMHFLYTWWHPNVKNTQQFNLSYNFNNMPCAKSFVFIHVKYVKFVHMSLELAVIPRVTVSVVGETGVDILSRFSVELCI